MRSDLSSESAEPKDLESRPHYGVEWGVFFIDKPGGTEAGGNRRQNISCLN